MSDSTGADTPLGGSFNLDLTDPNWISSDGSHVGKRGWAPKSRTVWVGTEAVKQLLQQLDNAIKAPTALRDGTPTPVHDSYITMSEKRIRDLLTPRDVKMFRTPAGMQDDDAQRLGLDTRKPLVHKEDYLAARSRLRLLAKHIATLITNRTEEP